MLSGNQVGLSFICLFISEGFFDVVTQGILRLADSQHEVEVKCFHPPGTVNQACFL